MTEPRYLIPGDYSADPAAHVFGGRLFVYPSHDRDAGIPERDNGDHFDMVDYHAYEILPGADGKIDPMKGEVVDHGVILRLEDVPWASRQLWDSDVAEKDGRYYMYFSARDRAGSFRIGVAVAVRPEGPFVAEPEPIRGSYSIDPCCFADPKTGARYLAFGGLWGGQLQRYRGNRQVHSADEDTLPDGVRCALEPADGEPALSPKLVRLLDDMKSFAEEPRDLVILDEGGEPVRAGDHARRFFEASWLCFKDGLYSFSYSTGDTHLLCEAVSETVEGPYRYRGELLGPQVGWTTHHCLTEIEGRWYLFHHDSAPSGGRTWLRSLKVAPLPLPFLAR